MTDKVEIENAEPNEVVENIEQLEPVEQTEETTQEVETEVEVEEVTQPETVEVVAEEEDRKLGQYVMTFSEFIAERKIESALEGLSEGAKAVLTAGVGEGIESVVSLSEEQAEAFLATEAVGQLGEMDKDAIGNFIRTAVQANIRNIVKTVSATKRQENKETELKRSLEKVRANPAAKQ